MSGHELVDRVAALRRAGRTPKEIARALGLKPAEVSLLIRAVAATAPRRQAPLAGCWVTDHWSYRLTVAGHPQWPGMSVPEPGQGASGLIGVLVARDTGSNAAVCGYLVDAWCLGVKDTAGPSSIERRKLPQFVSGFFGQWTAPPVPAPLEMARHLVFGAVDYARGMGFEPHPDFARGAPLLGDWPAGSSDVSFGMDGKPMYISGPHDDAYGIIARLRAGVGDGNFDFMVGSGPRTTA
jgi:hypothetical protein